MFLLWRCVYGLLRTRLAVACSTALLQAVAAVRGPAAASALLDRFEHGFAFSGWPTHGRNWINLDISRFTWRVRRTLAGARPVPALAARPMPVGRLRIGIVGRFAGLLGFPKILFEAFPTTADLFIVDLPYAGHVAPYLKDCATGGYVEVGQHESAETTPRAIASINAASLDLLINVGWKTDAFELLDGVTTPVIFNYCTGSDLLHHPKVSVQLHGQPQADYFIRDHQMFCGTTRAPFGPERVFMISGYIDPRDLPLATSPAWPQRDPLVVFHGSLFKLAKPAILDLLCQLLADDTELEFALMGKDNGTALDAIMRTAERYGVRSRVHYEGAFVSTRGADGRVADPGWQRAIALLQHARLVPDPWPVGGGSSRYEAYALGAPSVHMAVKLSPDAWGRPQLATCEVPSLLVAAGTATTIDGYRSICRSCLYDEAFATALVQQQVDAARRVTDGERWWREVFDAYAWHRSAA